MHENNELVKIDLNKIAGERFPGKKIPRFVISLLKKIAHQDDINKLFALANGKKNMDFIDVCADYFQIKCNVSGIENLQKEDKPLIFSSNHPLGALEAISIAYVLGHHYNGKVKFYANEFLNYIEPLEEMFLPIYKSRIQERDNVRSIQDFYNSDNHLVTFPAGATSHMYGKMLVDLAWRKNFITASVQHKRNVVPLYFDARNSKRFYRVQKFSRFIRSKLKFESLLLADEIFRRKENVFTLYIGEPIPWQTFNKSKTHKEWATWVKEFVYKLAE